MIKTAEQMINEAQADIHCVDAKEAKCLFDTDPDAFIIDVREADSVAKSKLTASHHISRGLLEMKIHKLSSDPDSLILTHCGGGGRASLAAQTLQNMGYRDVYAITDTFEHIKTLFG